MDRDRFVPRRPFPSRPDPRAEEDTPPHSTREPSAFEIVRDEQRDLRSRIGTIEERVDKLEDWQESTAVRELKVKKRSKWWLERLAKVGETIVAAVILLAIGYAISRIACVPASSPTRLETKP
jgi:hypothetical protein